MLKEDELTYKIRGCVFKRWSQTPMGAQPHRSL